MDPSHAQLVVPAECADEAFASSGAVEAQLACAEAPLEAIPIEPATELESAVAVDEAGWLVRQAKRLACLLVGLWGAISIVVGLALLATIPVLNLLSLGYLLESSGRVARTGRLSAGLIGLRPAALVGALALGAWLVRWPILLVADLWYASYLIDPASRTTKVWGLGWFALVAGLAVVAAVATTGVAMIHPGRFARLRDAFWMLAVQRVPSYFWLGLRGFVGSMLWLVLPVSILACGAMVRPEAGAAISLLGGLLLTPVVMMLPFLQTHFAAENRLAALYEVGTVRRLFAKAPIAFWLALVATLLLALPLYLLMIEAVPREVTWLPSILFVLFLWPARLLCGWAYGRAARRKEKRIWLSRWLARLGMLIAALAYAFFVWLGQFLLWQGVYSLYHQHAFLVPVPFLGG
jgi:hypothetical protein